MGNEQSLDKGMKIYLKQEFDRLCANKDNKYLTISQILKLQHPENYPLSFSHLGALFLLDQNQTGRITLNDLMQFAQFCARNLKNIQTYEFQAHFQAMATQLLWESMSQKGIQHILNWLEKLLISNEEEITFSQGNQQVHFIRIDTVKTLFEIFNLKVMSQLDIQQFFDLLQQCGEEAGLMALDREELDEFVPVSVCLDFSRDFLLGFKKLMLEIGFGEVQTIL